MDLWNGKFVIHHLTIGHLQAANGRVGRLFSTSIFKIFKNASCHFQAQ